MSSNQGYVVFLVDSSSEPKIIFLDDPLYPSKKKIWDGTQNWLHWIFHGFSVVEIIGLLLSLHGLNRTSQAACWDKFNYYSLANDAAMPYPYIHN
ncbi:hypothetical protein GGS24DRAFT_475300 [Hypoxylon argillaceum]|nr:hypothetical protein GGS24DRAFT_475300 [Hypoxylon argillaceum]